MHLFWPRVKRSSQIFREGFDQGLHTLIASRLNCISYRKDEGNSSAKFVDVPVSSLNVQLPGQSGSGGLRRRRRATELSWFLTGLEEYTIYIIYVLFYTVGVSPYSLPLEIQTAEDGTCEIVSRTSGENRKAVRGCEGCTIREWRRRGSRD